MLLSLLPLLIGPAILLPLAAYAYRRRQVRGAAWYAALLTAVAIWSGFYAAELATDSLRLKVVFRDLKYLGVTAIPVAWMGFVLDFVARERRVIRAVTSRMAVASATVLAAAWTNPWHGLYWGTVRVQQVGSISLLIGRGPLVW